MSTKYFGSGIAVPLNNPENKDTRNYVLEEILKAVLKDTDIVQAILRAQRVAPQPVDIDKYYEYGRDNYIYGLPKVSIGPHPLGIMMQHDEDKPYNDRVTMLDHISLFPMAAFRSNKVTLKESDEAWATTKELCKIALVDLQGMIDSVEENPDIDAIDDCHIGLNIPITENSRAGITYIHDFLLHQVMPHQIYTEKDFQSFTRIEKFWDPREHKYEEEEITTYPETDPQYLNFSNGEFRTYMRFNYLKHNRVAGRIGSLGAAEHQIEVLPETKYIHEVRQGANSSESSIYYKYIENSYIIYRVQDEQDSYSELILNGPRHYTYVHRKDVIEPVTLEMIRDDPDEFKEAFFIPLDYVIMNGYQDILEDPSTAPKTYEVYEQLIDELTFRGLTLNINTLIRKKLKWYESSVFIGLLSIATLFIAVFTFQFYLAPILAGEIALTTALIDIGIGIAISTIISEVAVNILDAEFALILSLVLSIISLGGSAIGSFETGTFADALLSKVPAVSGAISSGLESAVQKQLADRFSTLQGAIAEEEQLMESFDEEMDRVLDLLNGGDMPPNFVGDVWFDTDEEPQAFYNRTIHSGNIGVLSYDTVHRFHEVALTLPKSSSNDYNRR